MHGLIFATWQKFLVTNPLYGPGALEAYRNAILGTDAYIPSLERIYDDDVLFRGVGAVVEHARIPLDAVLRQYGKFFLTNDFASAHFTYLLKDIKDARGLIMRMRHGHAQMRRAYDSMQAPEFKMELQTNGGLQLEYDSKRKLCALLEGVIEGAGWRFNEKIDIDHVRCMHKGALACQLALQFSPAEGTRDLQQDTLGKEKEGLIEAVHYVLPEGQGMSLQQLSNIIYLQFGWNVRVKDLYAAIIQLQLAGLTSSYTNPGNLGERLYKRVERSGETSDKMAVVVP
jgi:predicted hydrocarbon binding protein